MLSKAKPTWLLNGLILVAPLRVGSQSDQPAAVAFPARFGIKTSQVYAPRALNRVDELDAGRAVHSGARSEEAQPTLPAVFAGLVQKWKADQKPTSLMIDRAMHPAYLLIIGLGPPALPLQFPEDQREPDPWFWALEAISGENPIPESDEGRVPKMVAAWLEWGRSHGYLA
jgi:hypothetical protein